MNITIKIETTRSYGYNRNTVAGIVTAESDTWGDAVSERIKNAVLAMYPTKSGIGGTSMDNIYVDSPSPERDENGKIVLPVVFRGTFRFTEHGCD